MIISNRNMLDCIILSDHRWTGTKAVSHLFSSISISSNHSPSSTVWWIWLPYLKAQSEQRRNSELATKNEESSLDEGGGWIAEKERSYESKPGDLIGLTRNSWLVRFLTPVIWLISYLDSSSMYNQPHRILCSEAILCRHMQNLSRLFVSDWYTVINLEIKC